MNRFVAVVVVLSLMMGIRAQAEEARMVVSGGDMDVLSHLIECEPAGARKTKMYALRLRLQATERPHVIVDDLNLIRGLIKDEERKNSEDGIHECLVAFLLRAEEYLREHRAVTRSTLTVSLGGRTVSGTGKEGVWAAEALARKFLQKGTKK